MSNFQQKTKSLYKKQEETQSGETKPASEPYDTDFGIVNKGFKITMINKFRALKKSRQHARTDE